MTLPPLRFVTHLPESTLAPFRECDDIDALIARDAQVRRLFSDDGNYCWIILTYLRLRDRTEREIVLASEARRGAINVVHSARATGTRIDPGCYTLVVRADFGRRPFADFHLVQNPDQLQVDTACMPLWRQPALIPRDPARRGLSRAAYIGQPGNGSVAVMDRLREALGERGIAVETPPLDRMHDMGEYDCAFALRSLGGERHPGKPPSKMVNAWFARMPFVGGPDSAYDHFGTRGETYLRATSPDEIVAHIGALQDDPQLYARMVAKGEEARAPFEDAALARRWLEVIARHCDPAFARHAPGPVAMARRRALQLVDAAKVRAGRGARKLRG